MTTATTSFAGRLRTPLTDLFGIDVPILQSGMGGVAGPELAAEVSNAGGLGILAGFRLPAAELRSQIRRLRELTRRPFGVNLWLHPDVEIPLDPGGVAEALVQEVQGTLNRFRGEMDLPPSAARPPGVPDVLAEAFQVVLDERVAVWSIGLGDPGPERVRLCHERGIKVLAMATNVEDAKALAASGVDAIVAQGGEAGGHRSVWGKGGPAEAASIGTMALVPQIVDAVSVPVIAAGGIADGRGLVAALALGAAGVLLGTRFLATRESQAAGAWKQALLERGSQETTLTKVFTGLYARVLRNTFTAEYGDAPTLPPLLQRNAAQDIYAAATTRDDGEHMPLYSGQSLGLIHDLPGAGEVVARIVEEAQEALARLQER
ncbi:MAG TPA: nitronate monooxygenase [Thermoanaerobaculia bacterium]|nr:nitronate monooxygenase [Thermoanaerobaculia bacterium]